jgi:hypothetical protein
MGLTMSEKRSVVREKAVRYRKAGKKEKTAILDEVVELTGYNRCYGSQLLSGDGRRLRVGSKTTIVGDATKKTSRHKRDAFYDREVLEALKKIWMILDYICGKRLQPALKDVLEQLERNGELQVTSEVRKKLLGISAATIDRLLAEERKKLMLKGRSRTRRGTLLKNQIPIRTFSDWNEKQPGFVELDLVAHDGGSSSGDFCQTLDVTDICTGWTETEGVRNKAQVWVFEALKRIRSRLPFQLLGIDSDNGGEFINSYLVEYCGKQRITFTRARPYRKNDNCFVEEKNNSVVRRNVGYLRHDTQQELEVLNRLYSYLRLYTNHFLPVMKLVSKQREGARVSKKHDRAQTPYQRLLASGVLSASEKRQLFKQHRQLNPAQLKREITALQEKLMKLANSKRDSVMRSTVKRSSGRERTKRVA